MKMPPTGPDNKNSRLLSNEENMQVFKLLGNRCQSICTTVAQLFCTEPPYHSQWIKKDVGVLCFVKDNIRKNYFFRMFCLRRNSMVWEQEMYRNMEYNDSTVFLHIFEGEDTVIAFNFANIDEAKEFKNVVDEKVFIRKRREEKRTKQAKAPPLQQNNFNYSSQTLKEPHDYKRVQDPAVKQAKRKRNITKADIGVPLNFQHISHVGWNPDSGFDIDSQDENLRIFFAKAGISEKQLQDRDTKEFIYDFINKHGGREAVEKATNRHSSRRAPAIPHEAPVVPPVPPRGPPRPHVRVAPPPPPPVVTSNAMNFVQNEKPPPPPPPLDGFGTIPPPPPPPVPNFNDTSNDVAPPPPLPTMGSALLESIKSGTTLRPVEDREMPPSPVEDSRGQLLKEIREGTKLKPVVWDREVKPMNIAPDSKVCELALLLSNALIERARAIQFEEDDSDETDSNDDDWY